MGGTGFQTYVLPQTLAREKTRLTKLQDVDLIVMHPRRDVERLKQLLCRESDGRFYTVASRSPNANYRVLFYQLEGRRRSCKVDILVPGLATELRLPHIGLSRMDWIDGLPVMPFLPLLILTVQGWRDHRHSSRADFNAKVGVDVRDINELLRIGRRRREDIQDESWLKRWFLDHADNLVQEYVDIVGERRSWELLGFNPL